MSRKRIKKAQGGLRFNSSPLTSITPEYSFSQSPNFNTTLQFGQRQQGFQLLNPDIQNTWDNFRQNSDEYGFNIGLKSLTSSDPYTKQWDRQLVQDGMNKLNQQLPQSTSYQLNEKGIAEPTGFNPNLGMTIGGAVFDLASTLMPEKSEYAGNKGDTTQIMDTLYDGISDTAMAFGPVGMAVGTVMKGGKFLGKGINALGGGTDGMCVCAGTKVYTATGAIVNIEDLSKEQGIIGWSEVTKQIVPQTIHNFIEPRQKECLKITLKSGKTLRCSIDHPILSDTSPKARSRYINGKRIAIREWQFRRADELKVGDFVGLANNIDYWGDKEISKAYLIGMLIGDSSYTEGSSCRIISTDPETWNYLEDNSLGIINHCDDSRPEKYKTEVRTYRIIDGMNLMRSVGLVYQSGKNKTLPKNLGEWNKQSVCQLIAGLFDTDGSISVNTNKDQYSITLYQSNKSLLEEVRQQLHKLGIFSTIGTRKSAKYEIGGKVINSKESFRLDVHDIASTRKFYELIHLNISRKQNNLEQIFNMLASKAPQEHNDISGAKQSKIVSIEAIGIQTVYNLQADNDHTYLANGIITHNTNTDAILGSSFLSLSPLGLINGFGGSRANTFTKDTSAFETVGASYTGSESTINDSSNKSGKKYGLFSQSAKNKANKLIDEAKRQQNIIANVADQATDRFSIAGAMSAINGNRRRYQLQGGYNQSAVRVGKQGMVIQDLQRAQRIVSSMKYQKGGKMTDPFNIYLQSLPENQRDSTNFRVKDYWEFNGRPKNFDEAVSKGMFTQFEDGWHANSVAENPKTGDIEFMKSSSHPSIQQELDWYNSDEGSEFRNQYELQKTEPYFKYVKRKGSEAPQSFKEGGNITNSNWIVEVDINNLSSEYKGLEIVEVDLDSILPEFKEGGKFNLIPEGALHARKHNIDVDGITSKGIPVVSRSDGGEIEQQAEIEKEEIIFRLEVTKKLEELAKDGSDEAAIEAGKLLVEEILYNTIDNTHSLI